MYIRKFIFLMAAVTTMLAACYKDKGNYDIDMPETPVVSNLDSVYTALVGDSLIIKPTITMKDRAEIQLLWHIGDPETGSNYDYTGSSLRIIYGLGAKKYPARLTVYNRTNGMKYFHDFFIEGKTDFGTGTAVLSVENGVTQFSFVKTDGTVQARIFRAMQGVDLPPNPLNLFLLRNKFTGNTVLGYWIVTKNAGVRLVANTLDVDPKNPSTLADNFFSAPAALEVGSVKKHPMGVMIGVFNGKLYGGTTSTWDQSTTYGMFGHPTDGDYELAPSFVMSYTDNATYFIAFDKNRKQFLRFNQYGGPTYFGTSYSVTNTTAFDPVNVGMDLVHMEQLNNADCYAYCKGADGIIYELKFTVQFNGPFTFNPQQKRRFLRQDLISESTKWQGAKNGVIYIGSGSKVYRYNPLNEEIKELDTDFGGKTISMVKLSDDEQSLMVGNEGTIFYLDISTGNNGKLIKKTEGIPGAPVDMERR